MRCELLKLSGYEVIGARSGKEAIDVFRRAPSISAIIVDFWMPQMNGRRVAENIREIRPSVPIIMLTGTRPILDEELRVNAWIVKGESKPEDLLAALTKLLKPRK